MWNSPHGTVLSEAASSGSKKSFQVVVAAVEKLLKPAEVMVDGLHECRFSRYIV